MFISSVAPALSSLPIYNLAEILRSSGMSQGTIWFMPYLITKLEDMMYMLVKVCIIKPCHSLVSEPKFKIISENIRRFFIF